MLMEKLQIDRDVESDILYRNNNVFILGMSKHNRKILKVMVFKDGRPNFVVYDLSSCTIMGEVESDDSYETINKMRLKGLSIEEMMQFFRSQLTIMERRGYTKEDPKRQSFLHYLRALKLTDDYRKGLIN